MMMMSLVLLAVLFICGLINSLLQFPFKKLLVWIRSLLPKANSISIMSTATTMAPKKEKKKAHDKAELERVFATFDKNGDGFITKQELGESLQNMGLFTTDKEVVGMVEMLDANGDGLIDLGEFCVLYESMWRRQDEGRRDGEVGLNEEENDDGDLREAFNVFDGNRDGLITVEELGLILSSVGLKQGIRIDDCREMIKMVDIDGDGMVNFDEFKKMMKSGGSLVVPS